MGKVVGWTLLSVVLVIFVSGAVAFYTVFLSVNDGITMPLMRNMSLLDAEREASRLGLNVRAETVVSNLPQWQVVAQYPEAGERVRSDRTITLHVSRGGLRRSIPDVRRLTASEAQNVLQEQGFSLGNIVHIQDDSRPGGTVIAQSPAAPANVPSDMRVDLLVSQGGPTADGRVIVPDVAGLPEGQARELLTAGGFRIATVDTVFSLRDTSGHVIGTRPAGGTMAREGDGVRLRVATHTRPAGTPEPPEPQVAELPVQDDVLIGNETLLPPAHITPFVASPAVTPAVGLGTLGQQQPTGQPQTQATQPTQPAEQPQVLPAYAQPQPVQPVQQVNLEPAGGRIARIRYQVPPLTRPLPLRIELTDPSGRRVLLDRDARSGEHISLDVPYTRESVVTIYLGDQFVWQDRFM